MTLSNSIKVRFLKDFKIPIQVVQEPFFSYAIETLDPVLNTQGKLDLLIDIVSNLGNEELFFAESNHVKKTIIDTVQATPSYRQLQQDKLEKYDISKDNQVKQADIYHMGNVNKTFISLDLKHANFNVMKMYDTSLVMGFDSYESLVGSISQFEYFKQSKYLRQVIFGNMLPKKQQKLQKWVMSQLIHMLHTDIGIAMEDFVSASADEVLFVIDPENADKFVEMINRKLSGNETTKEFASWVRVESFKLESIGNKTFFVKRFMDNSVDFKGIPSFLFMQVFKKYIEENEEELDRVFYHEGFMATFKEGVFDE